MTKKCGFIYIDFDSFDNTTENKKKHNSDKNKIPKQKPTVTITAAINTTTLPSVRPTPLNVVNTPSPSTCKNSPNVD